MLIKIEIDSKNNNNLPTIFKLKIDLGEFYFSEYRIYDHIVILKSGNRRIGKLKLTSEQLKQFQNELLKTKSF